MTWKHQLKTMFFGWCCAMMKIEMGNRLKVCLILEEKESCFLKMKGAVAIAANREVCAN